ncbi:hypothetical protein, partial [Escherichia coli]|uniref:hypothetical protein n=1 Tax=Escherichia coli TaxID=562 RepID=UPI001965E88B
TYFLLGVVWLGVDPSKKKLKNIPGRPGCFFVVFFFFFFFLFVGWVFYFFFAPPGEAADKRSASAIRHLADHTS